MATIRLHGQIDLNLASHVSAQIHITQGLGFVGKVEDNRAGQLVVGHASAISSLEDVNAVPFTRALSTGGDTWQKAKVNRYYKQSFLQFHSHSH
jgi:hypothetical protein